MDKKNKNLEIHHIKLRVNLGLDDDSNVVTLCSICHYFAPNDSEKFASYLSEKIEGNLLNTFRNYGQSTSNRTSFGMERKTKEGGTVTKPPFGYNMVNKCLEIDPAKGHLIPLIYQEYLSNASSLNKLAQKYGLTTNGLKKVLANRVYLGEVKFAGEVRKGLHQPLLPEELFNRVQERLRK